MRDLAPALLLLLAVAGCDKAQLGAACGSDDDCANGLCLADLPGGLCATTCDDGCGDGSVCVDLGGDRYCLPACEDNEGCRNGYACSLGHCDLPCASHDECPPYAACDDRTLGCGLRLGQGLGEACVEDAQCEDGLCIETSRDEGGLCSWACGGVELCAAGLPCGLVDRGGELVPMCRPPVGAGLAGDLCASGEDCASGLCAGAQCVFPCDEAGSCGPAELCERGEVDALGRVLAGVSYCEPQAAPGVRVVDLGARSTDRGVLEVEIDAPEGIVAFALVAWTEDPVVIAPRSLIAPSGAALIDRHGVGVIRFYDQPYEVTLLVPNTDDPEAAVEPGRYSVELRAHEIDGAMLADALIRVRVLLKVRESGLCPDGHMVLNVHLAPHVYGSLDASNAPGSDYLGEALDRMRHFYGGGCGVEIDSIRYFDMTDRFGVIGSMDELHEMFSLLSVSTPRASANLFVVRDLSGISEWVAGIAGGLPGPPCVTGTVHSGVAIEAQADSEILGDTMSHEVGHFLGLFHPTEMDGRVQDPILDTPTCTFDPDAYYEMMACETFDNIMFPVLTGTADDITAGQCFVVRGNPGL